MMMNLRVRLTQLSRRPLKYMGSSLFVRGFDRHALDGFMKVYPNQVDGVSIMTLFDLT